VLRRLVHRLVSQRIGDAVELGRVEVVPACPGLRRIRQLADDLKTLLGSPFPHVAGRAGQQVGNEVDASRGRRRRGTATIAADGFALYASPFGLPDDHCRWWTHIAPVA